MEPLEKISLFLELISAHLCILIITLKGILILGEEPAQRLDDTKINSRSLLILYNQIKGVYNGSNSLLFVNAAKIYQFKAKSSEIKDHALCLGNVSKYSTSTNIKKQD